MVKQQVGEKLRKYKDAMDLLKETLNCPKDKVNIVKLKENLATYDVALLECSRLGVSPSPDSEFLDNLINNMPWKDLDHWAELDSWKHETEFTMQTESLRAPTDQFLTELSNAEKNPGLDPDHRSVNIKLPTFDPAYRRLYSSPLYKKLLARHQSRVLEKSMSTNPEHVIIAKQKTIGKFTNLIDDFNLECKRKIKAKPRKYRKKYEDCVDKLVIKLNSAKNNYKQSGDVGVLKKDCKEAFSEENIKEFGEIRYVVTYLKKCIMSIINAICSPFRAKNFNSKPIEKTDTSKSVDELNNGINNLFKRNN